METPVLVKKTPAKKRQKIVPVQVVMETVVSLTPDEAEIILPISPVDVAAFSPSVIFTFPEQSAVVTEPAIVQEEEVIVIERPLPITFSDNLSMKRKRRMLRMKKQRRKINNAKEEQRRKTNEQW